MSNAPLPAPPLGEPDQALRLRAAALIKAIADGDATPGEDTFDARLADDLAALLAPMPTEGASVSLSASFAVERGSGAGEAEGAAAGGGGASVPVPEEEPREARGRWSLGERAFRCGAYVVTKHSEDDFEVRHVGDVDALFRDDELMGIERGEDGEWRTTLNRARSYRFLFINLTMPRSVPWRRGVRP